jgi:hypothetical protein
METYTPLESWSGTERFGYTISDGRGGVATSSMTVIIQPSSVENQPPEAQDQDVTVNGNDPVKIKLGARCRSSMDVGYLIGVILIASGTRCLRIIYRLAKYLLSPCRHGTINHWNMRLLWIYVC